MKKQETNIRIAKNHPVKARLIEYLTAHGIYNVSADETIDLYVETYEHYQRMRSELQNGNLIVEHINKFGALNKVKNPLLLELTKTAQLLSNLLKSMNLTPAQLPPVDMQSGALDEFDLF